MDNVDLWYVRTDAVRDAQTIQACFKAMAPSERERYERFVFERHRHEYLVTRGLVRGVLSTYLEGRRSPAELTFVITEYGRPLLDDANHAPSGLRFNLTNTTELVACLVSDAANAREVGVDAEPLSRADQILGIAETVFTSAELAALAKLEAEDPDKRHRHAVELWTLKEAYMKARGLGMSLPPETIELSFNAEREVSVRVLGDDAPAGEATWAFTIHEIESHLVSTCVSCIPGPRSPSAPQHRLRAADLAQLLVW